MKEALEKYPEVMLLDATYRINDKRMPLYTLMIVDGYGKSIPAAYYLVANEEHKNSEHLFTIISECVEDGLFQRTKSFLIDKDIKEEATVKQFFPKVSVQYCLFHVFRCFKRDTNDIAMADKTSVILNLLRSRSCRFCDYACQSCTECAYSSARNMFLGKQDIATFCKRNTASIVLKIDHMFNSNAEFLEW